MKTSFWGTSLEIKALGYLNVVLKSTGEHFIIDRPTSTVNNLVFGDMYIEHYGTMTVKNLQSDTISKVEFKKRGWGGKNAYQIDGFSMSSTDKKKKFLIYGKWNDQMKIKNLETNTEE